MNHHLQTEIRQVGRQDARKSSEAYLKARSTPGGVSSNFRFMEPVPDVRPHGPGEPDLDLTGQRIDSTSC